MTVHTVIVNRQLRQHRKTGPSSAPILRTTRQHALTFPRFTLNAIQPCNTLLALLQQNHTQTQTQLAKRPALDLLHTLGRNPERLTDLRIRPHGQPVQGYTIESDTHLSKHLHQRTVALPCPSNRQPRAASHHRPQPTPKEANLSHRPGPQRRLSERNTESHPYIVYSSNPKRLRSGAGAPDPEAARGPVKFHAGEKSKPGYSPARRVQVPAQAKSKPRGSLASRDPFLRAERSLWRITNTRPF